MPRYITILLLALAWTAVPSRAAVEYTGDGVLSDRLEKERWHINRTRYAPEQEADAFLLVNTTAGGTPGYDTCEDTAGANDFGTTTNDWVPWRATMPPLAPNSRMNLAAARHAEDLGRVLYLTHPTPTGSAYYTTGINGVSREAVEGYTNSVFGYFENLNFGARASTPSFPSYGMHPEGVHSNLFVDTPAANRGHRKAILNNVAREIGLGHVQTLVSNWQGAGWSWTIDWDVQDFGREGSNHFFTGTIFHDANSNGLYNTGEGRPGIEVRLFNGGAEAAWFDTAQTSGNFAVPINDLPDGSNILVYLVNPGTSSAEVTIPLTYTDLGTFTLTAGAFRLAGSFIQPMGITNVGLRNLRHEIPPTSITLNGNNRELSHEAMRGLVYVAEYTDLLETPSWIPFSTNQPGAETAVHADSGTATQRFYRPAVKVAPYPF